MTTTSDAAPVAATIDFEVVEVAKRGEAHVVYGWASVAADAQGKPVVDLDGDVIPVEELEKAAHRFMLDSRASGEMHEGRATNQVVESLVVTPEKQAAFPFLKGAPQGWLVGIEVDEKTFAKVKKGERLAFSIEGKAHDAEAVA